MIVKDLIKELKKIDKNMPIVIPNLRGYNFLEVKSIVVIELEKDEKLVDVVCLSVNSHNG